MIATTIEQSKKLLELGLDPETADMQWWRLTEPDEEFQLYATPPHAPFIDPGYIESVPAWSLGVLLELIPFDVHLHELDSRWSFSHPIVDSWHRTPLDAAYNMVVYLLEQDYILTEKK